MDLRLDGRNALVTGGTRGIGRAISLALADAGCNVVACYRSDQEAAAALERDLADRGGKHAVLRADVADPGDVRRLVDEYRSRLGSLDVLVHNAGSISHVPFDRLELDEWRRVIDGNLTSMFLVVNATLELLSSGSSVIGIGSKVAFVGVPLRGHYTAAKAGMAGLTRSLAKELGPRGIRVNLIAPGIIDTDQAAGLSPEMRERYRSMTSVGRLGEPEDVADVAVFLAGAPSRFITGETINVDGGM
ncbi:SDR family NAD(P)-dependent oxidoreductase [Actinoallomurus vinaceus]|uniref:SDR family NAD(P)-dependent oxidoreductase n=1 Tax=Actinoallomurus vinaceus TaxID=1080074 RepID=A0ABP8UW80_9ACTN